jgi:hypothetical protein
MAHSSVGRWDCAFFVVSWRSAAATAQKKFMGASHFAPLQDALALQRHLSVTPKLAYAKSGVDGLLQHAQVVFYASANRCVTKHVRISDVVGLALQRHLHEHAL